MSNQVSDLLNEIQFRTGKTLDDIAIEIGYSRPHLNNVKLGAKGNDKIEGILKAKYAEILQNVSRETNQAAQSTAEWLKRLDYILENNRMLTEANLLLAKRISSDETGIVSSPFQERKPKNKNVEQREGFSDKPGKSSSVVSRKLVGSGSGKNK